MIRKEHLELRERHHDFKNFGNYSNDEEKNLSQMKNKIQKTLEELNFEEQYKS